MTGSKSNCFPIIPVQNYFGRHTKESGGILLSGTYINECLGSGKNPGPIAHISIMLPYTKHLDAVFQMHALYGSAETRWEHKELLLLSARRTPDITDVAATGNGESPENSAPFPQPAVKVDLFSRGSNSLGSPGGWILKQIL